MFSEPELVQRQPEWDRQLESIDTQELEIHQSQLRLMRDQTAVFVRDLDVLRNEVLSLRNLRGEMQNLDSGLRELREAMTLEGAKRDTSRARFEQCLCSELEQVLGAQLHTSLEADRGPSSPELVAQDKGVESAVEPTQGSVFGRINRLEAELQGPTSEKLSRFHKDIQELREVLGGERLTWESHKTTLQDSLEDIHSNHAHLSDRFANLERLLAEASGMQNKELMGMRTRLDTHHTSGAERILQLEASIREADASRAASLEELRLGQMRQEAEVVRLATEVELIGTMHTRRVEEVKQDVESEVGTLRARIDKVTAAILATAGIVVDDPGYASSTQEAEGILERMDYLESMMGASSDKHERILQQTRDDVEKIFTRLSACDGTCEALAERLERESRASPTHHVEDLKALREEQAALALELPALRVSLAGELSNAKAAMEERSAGLKDRMQHVEHLVGSHVEQYTAEMVAIRKTDTRHSSERAAFSARLAELEHGLAAAGGGCEELLAAVRSECARQGARLGELSHSQDRIFKESDAMEHLCRSLQDRMDGLEASFDEHAGRQELSRSAAAFECFQVRLESCERDTKAVRDLLVKHDGLAGTVAAREAEFEHSAQRMDDVHRLVTHAAEANAKALESVHAGMEKLRGRVLGIEGRRHTLENLRADLADDKAANDARLASLEGRVDGLGRRLSELGTERIKEVEAALNVRVATLEIRMEGVGRRVTEAAGERARDLQVMINERLEPLEGRLEDLDQQPTELVRREGSQDLEARLQFVEDMLVKMKEAHSEDLELMKSALAAHAGELESINVSVAERLDGIDRAVAKDIAMAQAKLEHFDSRLSACEEHSTTVGETRNMCTSHTSLSIDSLDTLFETLKERVDVMDGTLADLKGLQESHAREVQARMEAFEGYVHGTRDGHASEIESLRALCVDHSKELRSLKTARMHDADFAQRLDECEHGLLESGADHAESIAAIHAKLEHIGSRLGGFERQTAALGDLRKANLMLTNDKTALESLCETLKDRVDSIDSTMTDAAYRHSRELEAARAAQERHSRDFEAHKATQGRQQAALAERLEVTEAALRDASEQHADGLAGAHAAIEHLRGRAAVWERHGNAVVELQKAANSHARERADREAQHASLEERLEEVGTLGEMQERTLEALGARMEKLSSRLSACERQGSELRGQQSGLADSKALLESQFATVKRRVDCLGEAMGDCFDQRIWELETVQENVTSSASQVRHPTVEDRLRQLEAALAEAAGRQTRQQEAVRVQLRELQQRNAQEQEAREAWQDSLQECMSTEKTSRDAQFSSVDSRLKAFEDALASAEEKQSITAAAVEVIGKVEERHSRELDALTSTHSTHSERLEAACSRVHQLEHGLAEDREARNEGGNSLEQRLTALEHSIGESAARHEEALQAHRETLGQHVGPLEERLSELSKFYKEAVQDRAKQSQLDNSIVQQLQEQEKARELHEMGHREQLALEKTAREAIQNKLDQLERSVAEAIQSKLDQLEDELAQERADRNTAEETLSKSMGHLELRVGELAQPVPPEQRGEELELGERIDRLERKHTELLERCEESAAEWSRYVDLDRAVELQIQNEKRAREASVAEIHAELALERDAREAHEHLVQEQFSQDREAHERFQDRLQDILAREAEVRERRFEGYEEALQHEARARESCTQELRELSAMERTLREEHYEVVRDRLQALQKDITVCDSLMRQEIEARCKETMRLWQTMAGQSVGEVTPPQQPETDTAAPNEAPDPEATDPYVPFPCQPLTSFLRLGGQGLPERERRRRIRLFSPSSRSASPRSAASAPDVSPRVGGRRGRRKETSF